MSSEPLGYELPLLLFLSFRVLIDELHAELARQGHPDARPLHGFVCQAIGRDGTTATELGRRLGISKQAAAKTIAGLEQLGYVHRGADERDARRKLALLTDRGIDFLARSARIFDQLHRKWGKTLGAQRLQALETDLRTMTAHTEFRLDAPGWFGGG